MRLVAIVAIRMTIVLFFAAGLYFEETRKYGFFVLTFGFIGFFITEVLGRKNAMALQYSGLYIVIKWLWFAFDERD
jgi:inner membrane protein involved in colicin E2 resistance